eukprot:jgi/Psemu1/40171/gm1.40171_g
MNNNNNKHGYDTNNKTDDKGDDDEDEDDDKDTNTNNCQSKTPPKRRFPVSVLGSTGTISPLTTNTNTNNTNNNRGTRDNDDDANADTYNDNDNDNNKNTDATTMKILKLEMEFASDGEGSIANAFLMGDDNDALDNNADADDDVDVHTRSQDVFYYKDRTAVQQDVSFPKAPKDFMTPAAKSALGEPPWSTVGNPGLWDQYCIRPKFNPKKEGKYFHHQLPSGRMFNDWDFYYTGWIPEDGKPAYSRRHVLPSMVESELLFPSERKGLLNMRKLKLHGLTKERLILGDALFFYQLLLPLHLDPVDEAEEDPPSKRKSFCSEVPRWSSNYSSHGHTRKGHYYVGRIALKDVVQFDAIVFLHGALDGRKENICYRWVHSNALYSHKVAQTMRWYCWCQIKASLKLNCKLKARVHMAECKQDMSTFNYAYKFDYHIAVTVINRATIQ